MITQKLETRAGQTYQGGDMDIYCLIETRKNFHNQEDHKRFYFSAKAIALEAYDKRIRVLELEMDPYHICLFKASFTKGLLDRSPATGTILMDRQRWDWSY